MTNKKTTKRALLASVMALVLCFTMLLGTTYAWFTDSVTSAGNKIVAGTLDVDLYLWNSATEPVEITEESAPIFGQGAVAQNDNAATLWEPGKTQVAYLSIKNNGSLDLKYKVAIEVYDVKNNLIDVLEYAITPDAKFGDVQAWAGSGIQVQEGTNATAAEDVVLKAEEEHFFALSVHMLETATNEYQDGSATFDIKVLATQLASENDSFNNQYDANADYDGEISNATSLAAAFANGGTYKVTDNIVVDEYVTIPENVTVALDLNGNTLSKSTDSSIVIRNYGTLTLTGEGTIDGTINSYAIRTEAGSNLTIDEGVVVDGGFGAVSCFGGTLTINGGDFSNEESNSTHYVVYATNNSTVVINGGTFTFGEDQYAGSNGSPILAATNGSTIEINGGTFDATGGSALCYNANNIVIKGGTFKNRAYNTYGGTIEAKVADGYAVIKNDDGSYTVYGADDTMTVADGATLDLGGVAFPGKIVAEGDLNIIGDTSIKTLSSTSGGTITVEDGKTLTLNNFSFGSSSNADAEYVITGGTVTANYGFFQHGTYALHSDFETGYMYYSYGSDITVYGTFHSQGKGDGLDYVRGKVTIADGGKSIHDGALWVGQPESWGAMSATLIVEEGGSVQAKSLKVHTGSTLQIDAETLSAGEVTSIVCDTLTVTGTVEAINNEELAAIVDGNKIVLK